MFGLATVAFGLNLKTLVLKKNCTLCVSNVYIGGARFLTVVIIGECFVFLLGSVIYKEEYF